MKEKVILFFVAFVAFLGVPIFMIGNSPIDYEFIVTDIFFTIAIFFSLITGILLCLINFLFNYKKLHKVSKFFIYFIFSWVVLAGFIFPVSTSTGMTNPNVNPINVINFILVFIFSLILSISSFTLVKKYVQIFLITITIVSVSTSIISIYKSEFNALNFNNASRNNKSIEWSKLSNKKNIMVVSFDGLSGNVVTELIKNDAELSKEFKDFTIFENAISQSPATGASHLGNIFGNHDYKSKGSHIDEILSNLLLEGYFEHLPWKFIEDSYSYHYDKFHLKPMYLEYEGNSGLTTSIATFNFFKYTIIRIGTKYSLKLVDSTKSNIFNYCRNIIKNIVLKNNIDLEKSSQSLDAKLIKKKGPEWDIVYPTHMPIYDEFISSLTLSDKKYSLRYMHFLFTHYPINFDENCEYRSDDKIWYDANQSEEGLVNLTKCALTKYVSFLNKLKELKVYDKTLVVLKSDHGKPQFYFSKPPNNLKINKHYRLGYNRYRPALMVKDFDSNNQKPKFKSELVSINDMSKTICEKANVQNKKNCAKFNGINLFDSSLKTDLPYYIYVPPSLSSNHKFENHISIKVPSRNISLLDAMKDSEFIELSEEQEKNASAIINRFEK